jgi:hypothetical protein
VAAVAADPLDRNRGTAPFVERIAQTFQPVVRLNRDTGERELVLMHWGHIPWWILLANSEAAPEAE